MADRIEVTVTLQDKRVTIEGPEDFVRGEVQRLTFSSCRIAARDDSGNAEQRARVRCPEETDRTRGDCRGIGLLADASWAAGIHR